MDRESATESFGKWVLPASKVQVANDVDQANILVGASPEQKEIEWVALREGEVSLQLTWYAILTLPNFRNV